MSDPTDYPELDAALRLHHDTTPEPDLGPIRREVLGRIAASDGKRTRSRKLVLATAGLAVIAAVTTTVAVWPTTPQPTVVASADTDAIAAITNAADVPGTMNLLIERVAKAQPLTVAQGGYIYTSERTTGANSEPGPDGLAYYWMDVISETWTAADEGIMRYKLTRSTSNLNARPVSEGDRAKLAKYGTDFTTPRTRTWDSRVDPPSSTPPLPPSLTNPTPAFLATVPTDVASVEALLRTDKTSPRSDYSLFKSVTILISAADALLSPELRSAIYQVLATVPGVRRVPGQTDLAGRAGVAIGFEDQGTRREVIIDPDTSRAIGERTIVTKDQGPFRVGMVSSSSTTDQKVVAELGEK